jgi:hypothetical protein
LKLELIQALKVGNLPCDIKYLCNNSSQIPRFIFGCRSSSKDYHYHEEWTRYAELGNFTYRVAFSRDGKEGEKRVYVQDLMKEERIWQVSEQWRMGVYLRVCSTLLESKF